MNFKTAILLFALAWAVAAQKNQKKITSLNILMPLIYEPVDQRVVQYTMQAYGGCYAWQSS